jgi:hypothetical protein
MTYTILTFDGTQYTNLDGCTYATYQEAYQTIIDSQEMDVTNCIGVTTQDRQDTLENETPCEQILIEDYDGENIPDNAEVFDTWIIN